MSSLNDKIDKLIQDINALGPGVPAECTDEVAALKQGARDLKQAELARDSALKNAVGGIGTAGSAVVLGVACVAAAETIIVPILCAVGAGMGVGIGALWTSGSADSFEAAEEEMSDVLDTMNKASDALCRCLMKHLH